MVWPFDDDLPRSSADIERLEGDPYSLRVSASDLRSLADDLGTAGTAAWELEQITSGTSWNGQAFDAYRTKVEKNPKQSDITNAQTTLNSAADALDTLASGIADCQSRIDYCRTRIDSLNIPADGDIPEELRSQVESIRNDVNQIREDYDGHFENAGGSFEELTGRTVYAEPPPGFFERVANAVGDVFEFVGEFAIGIVEGVWEMVKGLYSLVALIVQPWKWDDAWRTFTQIVQFAIDNPGEFLSMVGKAIVDWDTLMTNPGRWLGKLVPTIVLAIVSGGAGTAATALGRLGTLASRFSRLSRVSGKLNNLASGARRLDNFANIPARLMRSGPAPVRNTLNAINTVASLPGRGAVAAARVLTGRNRGNNPIATNVNLPSSSTNNTSTLPQTQTVGANTGGGGGGGGGGSSSTSGPSGGNTSTGGSGGGGGGGGGSDAGGGGGGPDNGSNASTDPADTFDGGDTGSNDPVDTGDTGDTGGNDPVDTSDTGGNDPVDTGDTGDNDPVDTGDTGDTGGSDPLDTTGTDPVDTGDTFDAGNGSDTGGTDPVNTTDAGSPDTTHGNGSDPAGQTHTADPATGGDTTPVSHTGDSGTNGPDPVNTADPSSADPGSGSHQPSHANDPVNTGNGDPVTTADPVSTTGTPNANGTPNQGLPNTVDFVPDPNHAGVPDTFHADRATPDILDMPEFRPGDHDPINLPGQHAGDGAGQDAPDGDGLDLDDPDLAPAGVAAAPMAMARHVPNGPGGGGGRGGSSGGSGGPRDPGSGAGGHGEGSSPSGQGSNGPGSTGEPGGPAPGAGGPDPGDPVDVDGPDGDGPDDPGGSDDGGSGPPDDPDGAAAPPSRPPRTPSQWRDIADPSIANDPRIAAHFRGPSYSSHRLSQGERNQTAAFVSNNGRTPPSIANRSDVRADPTNAVRFSGNGNHAEVNLIEGGDLRNAVQDAIQQALDSGERVTVRLVINRSPCGPGGCGNHIADYVTQDLPGQLQRPDGVSEADWQDAMRNVDIEVHAPYAYEGNAGPTTTRDLLDMEAAGVRVTVYQPDPGVYRTGNAAGGGANAGGNDGGGGEALNDTMQHLDDYRDSRGEPPVHWTDAANFPGGGGPTGGGPSGGGPSGGGPSGGPAGGPSGGPTGGSNGGGATGGPAGGPSGGPSGGGPATGSGGGGSIGGAGLGNGSPSGSSGVDGSPTAHAGADGSPTGSAPATSGPGNSSPTAGPSGGGSPNGGTGDPSVASTGGSGGPGNGGPEGTTPSDPNVTGTDGSTPDGRPTAETTASSSSSPDGRGPATNGPDNGSLTAGPSGGGSPNGGTGDPSVASTGGSGGPGNGGPEGTTPSDPNVTGADSSSPDGRPTAETTASSSPDGRRPANNGPEGNGPAASEPGSGSPTSSATPAGASNGGPGGGSHDGGPEAHDPGASSAGRADPGATASDGRGGTNDGSPGSDNGSDGVDDGTPADVDDQSVPVDEWGVPQIPESNPGAPDWGQDREYVNWPEEIRAEYDAYWNRHVDRLQDHFGPDDDSYDGYVDDVARLFDEGGPLSRFWDPDRGTFDESAWAGASVDARRDALQQLEDIRARWDSSPGQSQPPWRIDIAPGNAFPEGLDAWTDYADRTLYISEDLGCQDAMRLVVHEGFHAHQRRVVDDAAGPTPPSRPHPEADSWATSDEHYVTPEVDPFRYRFQPDEQDAYIIGDVFLDDLTETINDLRGHDGPFASDIPRVAEPDLGGSPSPGQPVSAPTPEDVWGVPQVPEPPSGPDPSFDGSADPLGGPDAPEGPGADGRGGAAPRQPGGRTPVDPNQNNAGRTPRLDTTPDGSHRPTADPDVNTVGRAPVNPDQNNVGRTPRLDTTPDGSHRTPVDGDQTNAGRTPVDPDGNNVGRTPRLDSTPDGAHGTPRDPDGPTAADPDPWASVDTTAHGGEAQAAHDLDTHVADEPVRTRPDGQGRTPVDPNPPRTPVDPDRPRTPIDPDHPRTPVDPDVHDLGDTPVDPDPWTPRIGDQPAPGNGTPVDPDPLTPRLDGADEGRQLGDDFTRSPRDPSALSPREAALRGRRVDGSRPIGGQHQYEAHQTRFTDGSFGVYKPDATGATAVREVAAARLSEDLGLDVCPPTTPWASQDGRPASMQQWADGCTAARPPETYSLEDRERMAVFDYVSGNIDRHTGNYLTDPDGHPVGIDHGLTFPETEFQRKFGITSGFVTDRYMHPLSEDLVEHLNRLDLDLLRGRLVNSGLRPEIADEALARLREVRERGMITGEAWPGRIRDSLQKKVIPPQNFVDRWFNGRAFPATNPGGHPS